MKKTTTKSLIDSTGIERLEVEPDDSWFVETHDQHGRLLVFLRVRVTGLLPRRVGPFPSKQVALAVYDGLANDLACHMDCEWEDKVLEYTVQRPFNFRHFNVRVEDELAQAYLIPPERTAIQLVRQKNPLNKRRAV